MSFYPSCGTENKIIEEGLSCFQTSRILMVNALFERPDGTIVEGITPLYIYDNNYSGSYVWRGVSKSVAEAKVLQMNSNEGTIGGDGSTGLKLNVSEPIISIDSQNQVSKIIYQHNIIMMGTATAQKDEGEFWSVHVNICYKTTEMSINKPKLTQGNA